MADGESRRAVRLALAAVLAAVAALMLTAGPAAAAAPPPGFFGVVPQGALSEADLAKLGGVGATLRIPVYWFEVEPRPGEYEFGSLDREIVGAAAHGVRVLPFVYGTPSWLAAEPTLPPLVSARARDAWRGFLAALVDRYGPGGTVWGGRAGLPVRRWQIWNEPNFLLFWGPRISPRGYARLLRISAAAIGRHDPGARIVAAGVAPIEGGANPLDYLRSLLLLPGVKSAVDAFALHPYTPSVLGVEADIRRTRQVMARAGAGDKPLILTELGAASDAGKPTAFDLGRLGQARYLEDVFRRVLAERRRWRLGGAFWFAWQDLPAGEAHCSFCQYAGLFEVDGEPKPSWYAFRQVAEGGASGSVR